jgi:SWI/SNF-related matrix-associated actin-dependent regulator 1 of chromatin subfamily A
MEAERLLDAALRAWQAASADTIQQSSHESAQVELQRALLKSQQEAKFEQAAIAELTAARVRIAELEVHNAERETELQRLRAVHSAARCDAQPGAAAAAAAAAATEMAQAAAAAAVARAASAEAALARRDAEARELEAQLQRVTVDARAARSPSPDASAPARLAALVRQLDDERRRRAAAEAAADAGRAGAAAAAARALELREYVRAAAGALCGRVSC